MKMTREDVKNEIEFACPHIFTGKADLSGKNVDDILDICRKYENGTEYTPSTRTNAEIMEMKVAPEKSK